MIDLTMIELEVPARSVVLANKLLNSLTQDDLYAAGFDEEDINVFGDFFVEVRQQAEEILLNQESEEDEPDEK